MPITTTSRAILGLLAIKPWTSYELTKQMSRSLSHFWPRAESKLYEEPKKLVAQGLVRASTRTVGKRSSTVYSITAAGRRELKKWMARPGAGPALEFELLLQVFFSENGTRTDLLATIDAAAAWAAERSEQNVEVAREYLAGRGAFPERVPQTALVAAFLTDYWDAIAVWAAQARAAVEQWPDDPSEAESPWRIIEAIAARGDADHDDRPGQVSDTTVPVRRARSAAHTTR